MGTPPLIKTRKHFIIGMMVYILFLSGLCITSANWKLNEGIILKVETFDRKLVTYKHHDLPTGNYFISGMQGDLFWHPKNLPQAMLLDAVNNKGTDFLDIMAMIIIAGIIAFMFSGENDTVLFTKNVSSGFMILIFALGMLGLLTDFARFQLAIKYVPYITHGQFIGAHNFRVTSFYYMVYPMLMFLMRLPRKGLQLQQDAELTI